MNGTIEEYKGDFHLIWRKHDKLLTKYLDYYIILCIFLQIILLHYIEKL